MALVQRGKRCAGVVLLSLLTVGAMMIAQEGRKDEGACEVCTTVCHKAFGYDIFCYGYCSACRKSSPGMLFWWWAGANRGS